MHFAEFLNEGFPAHLRILSPPTCVGFGTGTCRLVRSFSWQCSTSEFDASRRIYLSIGSQPYRTGICLRSSLPPSTGISNRQLRLLAASLHPQTTSCSTGIFACCPSPTLRLLSIAYACCLGLGPDLPWDDERCPGSLRLSVGQILTGRFATHTGILTSIRSSCPSGQPSTPMERSPTHACACRDFGSVLEPRIFSAQGLSTSELLRTL